MLGFWFVSWNLLCSCNGKKTASFITLHLMLPLGTLPRVPHHPKIPATSAVGTMAGVSSHSLIHPPSQLPSCKLSYCDWRLQSTVSSGEVNNLVSSLLMLTLIALCQRLHLSMTFCLMLSKEHWIRNQLCWSFVLALPLMICLGLCELLHLSQHPLPHLMINLG